MCVCVCVKLFLLTLVKPKVEIRFTPPYYKKGSDINVTCSATSYPPANSTDHYNLQHPANERVDIVHFTNDEDGVVYMINGANEDDEGLYQCHVTVADLTTTVDKNLTEGMCMLVYILMCRFRLSSI